MVTGIGDFSPHTVHGDPMMDVDRRGGLPRARAVRRRRRGRRLAGGPWPSSGSGPDTAHWIDVYRRFYGFYFSDAGDFDPALYGWCLRQLTR